MNKSNLLAESAFKYLNELTGEGDFGDEKDGGLTLLKGIGGELEVDISFTATGNAAEKTSGLRDRLELVKGGFLGGIEGDFWKLARTALWGRNGFWGLLEAFKRIFGSETSRNHEVGSEW